jgi:GTPase
VALAKVDEAPAAAAAKTVLSSYHHVKAVVETSAVTGHGMCVRETQRF